LRKYDGALLLVSHDKAFLNALSNRTLALSVGRMENYAGNYAFFERESVLRRELKAKAFKNQQRELQQTERFIERFRSKASKASQVQSRIKQLDKIERIEIEEDAPDIHFSFPEPRPSGHVVMELENVVKKYGDLTVFEGLNYRIEKGDRIAIVGVNGAGKSTFVRILAGEEPIQNGQIKAGHKVTASYFAQHQPDELDLSKDNTENPTRDGILSNGSVIIYVWRQKDADLISGQLKEFDVRGGIVCYHGGMDSNTRTKSQGKVRSTVFENLFFSAQHLPTSD
jgi:ATP-binding cassette subfamily F protein 3